MEVEWLILADAAQVVANKLYLMGGGWDMLTVNTGFPYQQRCAVAASFAVPWNETNQPQQVEIEVASEDGGTLASVAGQFEVGRPPGIPPGQTQRMQFAADLALTFAQPGAFVIIARIAGRDARRVHFNVVPGPLLATKNPQGGG